MPTHIYRRPNQRVTQVFRGGELKNILQSALQNTFSTEGFTVTPAQVQRLLDSLPQSVLGGEVVMIIEQWPLESIEAHGKHEELIYQLVRKSGNQYTRKSTIPYNPQTPPQQAQRVKLRNALLAWQSLTSLEKEVWNENAKNIAKSGYNLFLSNYLNTQ